MPDDGAVAAVPDVAAKYDTEGPQREGGHRIRVASELVASTNGQNGTAVLHHSLDPGRWGPSRPTLVVIT
jgi:hypothetical protein